MKKLILSIIILLTAVFFLPPKAEAQTSTDCHEVFTKESNSCLKESTKCTNECVDKAEAAMSLTVDGGKVNLECQRSVCDPASKTCNDQAMANFRACQDARKAKEKSVPEVEKETSTPVFIGEWFSRFSKAIDGLIVLPEAFDAVLDNKFYLAPDIPDLSELSLEEMFQGHWYPNKDEEDSYRPSTLTTEGEQKAWEFLPDYDPDEENITVIEGQGEIKMPTSSDFIPITSKGGDTLQVTYLDSAVRSTSDTVQLGYTWSADSGSVMNVPQWSEIKFRKPVEIKGSTSHTVELGQGEIEVKVRNNKPAENQFGVDAGWLGVTVSRTHFWISQSKDKKLAVIGVYEGEVEVKTKDGQTVKVKPDGGKPGVVVVSRQLSVFKLAAIGVILAVITGSIIWFLKKRIKVVKFSKKR
ncbi:FecR domain-containing protein [Candidatus Daviesbacteria bacterium]|nr:FecR domain-containing protein [Candidatus Daviesbacteria bacterium]